MRDRLRYRPFVREKFPTQRASNTENISMWWRHHEYLPMWFVCIRVSPGTFLGYLIHYVDMCAQPLACAIGVLISIKRTTIAPDSHQQTTKTRRYRHLKQTTTRDNASDGMWIRKQRKNMVVVGARIEFQPSLWCKVVGCGPFSCLCDFQY